jgi:excisionase family DNA binding protein
MIEWLSAKQAAESLGLSPSVVYEMAHQGAIAHYRVGLGRGKLVFRPADVEAYLESKRGGPKPKPPAAITARSPIPRSPVDYLAMRAARGRKRP